MDFNHTKYLHKNTMKLIHKHTINFDLFTIQYRLYTTANFIKYEIEDLLNCTPYSLYIQSYIIL